MTELAGIVILGVVAQWLAWRAKIPAILPLILIGLAVGPLSTLWTPDGQKFIEPVYNGTKGLFPGKLLYYFVSLAIGVILFEGSLTLKRKELGGVGGVIGKLITLGAVITFIGGALAAHFIVGLSWSISFLFSALIIVTGPTVIGPILRNLPLHRNISTVLKWEGILIDPLGALVAVLVFEFILTGGEKGFTMHVALQFGKILVSGFLIGLLAAWFLAQIIKRKWVPHYLLNVLTLATVLLVFVSSDLLAHESGLLAVVVMGMFMTELSVDKLDAILDFKESISVLLISVLFILLAANIDISDLKLLLDWRVLVLFFVVVFVLRPLSVFASTSGSELSINQKAFISWVGPRGIVAAGIASLFGIRLLQVGVQGAEYITPLVFMIVMGTVLLNASTARIIAKLLNVKLERSEGILIIGSNIITRLLATYLQKSDKHVVLIDNNPQSVERAVQEGLKAIKANIYEDDLTDRIELSDMGYLMAMTSNSNVNQFACTTYKSEFGEHGTYRLITAEEFKGKVPLSEEVLFSSSDDYIQLIETVREYPQIHELSIQSHEHFLSIIDKLNKTPFSIPVFIRTRNNKINIFPALYEKISIDPGDFLVYAGKPLELSQNE